MKGDILMKAKAKRNDSWLGIEKGETYIAEKHSNNDIFVHTDGYIILFDEKYFELIEE